MRKRINKILWYGDELLDEKAKAPGAATSADGLDGLNEGEIYISNNEKDPALFIRTSSGKVVRVGVNYEELKKMFLSKVSDDTASGLITFEKGIRIGNLLLQDEGDVMTLNNVSTGKSASFAASGTVSSLGVGEDEGGTGGTAALYQLVDVLADGDKVSGAEDGNVLMFDAATGKWYGKKVNLPDVDFSDINDKFVSIDGLINSLQAKDVAHDESITALQTKDAAIEQSVTSLQGQLNTLVSGDASSAIESFNEVVAFLKDIEDDSTLEGILAGKQNKITETNKLDYSLLTNTPSLADFMGSSVIGGTASSDNFSAVYWDGKQWQTRTLYKWALASVKPSYTTSEVTEGTRLYFTDDRAKSALKTTTDALSDRIAVFEKMFQWGDGDGSHIKTPYAFASDSTVSSLGVGTDGTSGISYDRLDSWDSYTDDKAGYVLSAALGWDLKTRLDNLDLGDFDLSGYLSKSEASDTYATIAALNSGLAGKQNTISDLATIREDSKMFKNSAASGITSTNITNWDTAYGWGNHADKGYAKQDALNNLGDAFDLYKSSTNQRLDEHDSAIQTNATNIGKNQTAIKANADAIAEINKWFTLEDGVLHSVYAIASDSTMSSLGVGSDEGGGAGSVIDLTKVVTDILPSADDTYNIGSLDSFWAAIYVNDVNASVITEGGLRVATKNWVEDNYVKHATLDSYATKADLIPINNSIISLQQSTFTGTEAVNYYRLTWFTSSGGNRNVDIPTYQGKGFTNIQDLNGVFMADYKMVYDILDYVDNAISQSGGSVNLSNYYTKSEVHSYVAQEINTFNENLPTIPTKTSQLTNDSGFITSSAIPSLADYAKLSSTNSFTAKQSFTAEIEVSKTDQKAPLTVQGTGNTAFVKFTSGSTNLGYLGFSAVNTPAWMPNDATEYLPLATKATTLAGYGITDGVKAGAVNSAESLTSYSDANPSFMGSVYLPTNTTWHNLISVRHRNGALDGNKYGMILYSLMTGTGNLYWQQRYSSGWDSTKKILDDSNFSNYALPLSGGTMTGALTIKNALPGIILHRDSGNPYIRFIGGSDNTNYGELGANTGGNLVFWDSLGTSPSWKTVIHSGNIGSQSVGNATKWGGFKYYNEAADYGNNAQYFKLVTIRIKGGYVNSVVSFDISGRNKGVAHIEVYPNGQSSISNNGASRVEVTGNSLFADKIRAYTIGNETDSSGNITAKVIEVWYTKQQQSYDSVVVQNVHWGQSESVEINCNIYASLPTSYESYVDATMGSIYGSITKLSTPRTIWGQSFDGTGNVSGALSDISTITMSGVVYMENNQGIYQKNTGGTAIDTFRLSTANSLLVGYGVATVGYDSKICGNSVLLYYGTSHTTGFTLNSSGNVTIGSRDLATTNYKLYVNGGSYVNGSLNIAGDILPSSTDTQSLGSTSSYWKNLYVGIITGHYQSGDVVKFSGSINANEGNVSCKSLTVNGSSLSTLITEALNTFNEENLGTAASYGVTTSVMSGSSSLVTSGAVYTALQNVSASFNGGTVANATTFNDNVVIKGEGSGFRMRTLTPTAIDFSYGQDYITLRGFSGTTIMWTIDSETGSADFNDAVTASSFEQSSDIDLKDILSDLRLSLGTMACAPLVRFDWKNRVNKKHHVGTIAQYWQGALPEVVSTTQNGTLALAYGELGVAMGISLANHLTELKADLFVTDNEVDKLKKRIEQLETENKRLQERVDALVA